MNTCFFSVCKETKKSTNFQITSVVLLIHGVVLKINDVVS